MTQEFSSLKTLSLALIVSSLILGGFHFASRADSNGSLSVTGSAKTRVTSDTAKWTGNFQRTVAGDALPSGYAQMSKDEQSIRAILKKQGIDSGVEFSTITVENPSQYNQNLPSQYILRQNVIVQSDDVAKLTTVAKNAQSIADAGVIFSTINLEYFYTKLPEVRVELLTKAVDDAKERAAAIAKSTGQSVGDVTAAASGVVQVLPVNSVEVSDYGAYDTQSIEKEIMVSVKASFEIK